MAENDPVTKRDLLDLETRLKDAVAETVRDAQTEILQGSIISKRALLFDSARQNLKETVRIHAL